MKRAYMREKASASKRQKYTPTPSVRPKRYQAKGVNDKSAFQDSGRSPELKNIDYSTSNLFTTGTQAWTITPINLMTQGTGQNSHVGRKVTLKSILLRTTVDCTDMTRLLIVYDKECNGAAATAADIFAVDRLPSPLNLDQSDRFIVLADVFPSAVGNNQIPQNTTATPCYEIYRKMSLPMLFNTITSATMSAVNCGAIYICTNGEGGTVTDEITHVRVRYTDA